MSYVESFRRLLPVDINFVGAESPTPSKLTGIFNYIQASYYVIESYLGNGIDYQLPVENFNDRKMIHSLAGALGKMSDLYKPINKLCSLQHLHINYGVQSESTEYTPGDGQNTEFLSVISDTNIPIALSPEVGDDYILTINFKGEGQVIINNGISNTPIALEDNPIGDIVDGGEAEYVQEVVYVISGGQNIVYITLSNTSELKIHGISLLRKSECFSYQNKAFNIALAMPLNQSKYWTVKAPCVHAYTNDGLCSVATCQFCIGNTYDVYLKDATLPENSRDGLPICGGDYFDKLPDELLPDPGDATVKYVAYNPAGSAKVYSAQSSLLMLSKYFMSKYSPFAAFNPDKYSAGDPIVKNETVLYDSSSPEAPILYDLVLYATTRPDIIYMIDTSSSITTNTNDRYFVIGGVYSVADMLSDVLKYLSEQQKPTTAVYAE